MCKLLGIGVDICPTSRMDDPRTRDALLRRCFTAQEAAFIASRAKASSDTMAGLWAAKEAALKALGTGLSLPMKDIEIVHTETGQPRYLLHGQALERACGGELLLSISHDGGMAIAFCTWSEA